MKIIIKFTVAAKPGIDALLMLTKELATEKYAPLVGRAVLDNYISANFNEQPLIAEVNNISNQWLVVYVDDQPAGYACISSKGRRPESLEGKKAARIRNFGVLKQYALPEVISALLDKCVAVCKPYQHVWIAEYAESPLLGLFESKGFVRQAENGQMEELPLNAVCLIAGN